MFAECVIDYLITKEDADPAIRQTLSIRALCKSCYQDIDLLIKAFANAKNVRIACKSWKRKWRVLCHSERKLDLISKLSSFGVIAGSFALHCFETTRGNRIKWKFNDVDLFVSIYEYESAIQVIDEMDDLFTKVEEMDNDDSDYTAAEGEALITRQDILSHLQSWEITRMSNIDWPRSFCEGETQSMAIVDTERVRVTLNGTAYMVNIILADMESIDRPFAVTDTFDITLCALQVLCTAGKFDFRMRDATRRAITDGTILLTDQSFKIRERSVTKTVFRQMERVFKYYARGYHLPVVCKTQDV